MACSKYTLTNIGSSPVNFNYRRCDDTMWQYQVNLDPNETKNIWLIDTTYSVSPIFQSSINLVDLGIFPPTSQPTPTPTATDLAPTPTPTATDLAPTPTPTQVLGNVYFNLGYDASFSVSACSQTSISTFYGIPNDFSSLTIGDIIYQEIQLINPIGSFYLSDGTNYVQTDSNGEIIVGLTPC
jgi:hypothetical protein